MRRRRGRPWRVVAAHPQCSGRHVPKWPRRLHRRDRRHRHGPQSRCRSHRFRGRPEVRRLAAPPSDRRRIRVKSPAVQAAISAMGRSARPDAALPSTRRCRTAGRPSLRSGAHAAMAEFGSRFHVDRRPLRLARQTAEGAGLTRAPLRPPTSWPSNSPPAMKKSYGRQRREPISAASGNAAKFLIIGSFRRRRMPSW